MKDEHRVILEECIKLLGNSHQSISGSHEGDEITLKQKYGELNTENRKLFFEDLKRIGGEDYRLATLIFSTLIEIINDEECMIEFVDYLSHYEIDVYDNLMICSQIKEEIFLNEKNHISYSVLRKYSQTLCEKLESELGVDKHYLSINERNSKKVVIMTQQLLSIRHAPTRILVELAYILQKFLGYEVEVVVALEQDDPAYLGQLLYSYVGFNPLDKSNNSFSTVYKGEVIKGYQFVVSRENKSLMRELIEEIYMMKPMFIWKIGDLFTFADIFKEYTTVVSHNCISKCPISEAQILLDYFGVQPKDEQKSILVQNNQRYLHFELNLSVITGEKEFKRSDFSLPEEAFIVSVIGNRLDGEVSEDFLDMLERIIQLDQTQSIFFLFIGEYENYEECMSGRLLKGKSSYIGFQKELYSVIQLTDLFLNPPRRGGATGAKWSICQGIPVVTLGECDVAYSCGDVFVCESLSVMPDMVLRYTTDLEYYNNQREKAYFVASQRENTEEKFAEEIDKVINIIFNEK